MFLKNALKKDNLIYFDSKEPIQRYARESGVTPDMLYTPDNGHLNALGNQVVADALARWLVRG